MHAKFQDHMTSGSGEEDFLKVFTIYGRGGHVTLTIHANLCSHFPRRLHMNFVFDWPMVSKKMFESNGHIHAYIPKAGEDTPLGSIFFININLMSIWPIAAWFSY